jgi:topoisomerase-4 subunit A
VCKLGDLVTKTRQGKDFMKVDAGARAQPPALVSHELIAALSSDARLLVFALDEIPERPNGGVGVQLLALPEDATLASVLSTDGKSLVVSGFKRARKVASLNQKQIAEHLGRRAQRGKLPEVGFKPDRLGE